MFEIAGSTHAGNLRPRNEDRFVADRDAGLAIVADGMGGELGSERAAERACAAIAEVARGAPSDAPILRGALERASLRVADGARADGLAGAGATIASLRLLPGEAMAEIAHVGDVRVYMLRETAAASVPCAAPRYCPPVALPSGDVMVCVTRDHSSVCELVERGHLTPEAARRHPLRSRISRALGRAESRADALLVPLYAGDRVLVCSDGLWSHVGDDAIAEILDGQPPQAACDALVAAALAAGGEDNITAVVVHWHGGVQSAPGPVALVPAAPPGPPELPHALRDYGRDLVAAARRDELDPVIGRDAEVKQLALALVSRRKPNALLLGEPGVGKTSIVEALAQRIAGGGVDASLARLRVIELSLVELVAGTKHRGDLESRVAAVIEAAEQSGDVVLFVDEFHALAPNSSDAPAAVLVNALKPALARGRLRVIGATTNVEFERHVARDEALARRFEIIQVAEPDAGETRTILAGLRGRLESHYRASVDDSALDAAIDLAIRYLPDRRLPDKAVDLLDRACARRMLSTLRDAAPIGRRDVALAVAERCRLPIELVERDAAQALANLEAGLRARVVGQDAAIATIASTLRRGHSPLRDPQRPVASFVFAGPTGVGKTSSARAIAELLYGRDALVTIDMSELADASGVARLVGAAPGYVGHGDEGQLTGPLRRRPASVVVLDEIEKAHADVLPVLLQIFGDGRLVDGRGRATSFREAIVVMTTNLPLVERARRSAGFHVGDARDDDADGDAVDAANRDALARHLRPELVGRIDAIVPFRALDERDHAAIVDVVVGRLESRLRAQGVAPPDASATRRRVVDRLGALGYGVRQVQRVAEEVLGAALDARDAAARAAPAPAVVMNSIRTRVQVAMLVVDRVASANVARVVDAIRCHRDATDLQLLKTTGDGALALFGSVDAAFDVARSLGATGYRSRRVIHVGRVRRGAGDELVGAEVALGERVGDGPALPDAPLLVTAIARERLAEASRGALAPAGTYRLSGLGEPVELWLVDKERA